MGRAKALLPIGDGDTFLTRSVRTCVVAGVDDVVVVLAHEAEKIAVDFVSVGLSARIVEKREQGQLTSLLAGLSVVDRRARRRWSRSSTCRSCRR